MSEDIQNEEQSVETEAQDVKDMQNLTPKEVVDKAEQNILARIQHQTNFQERNENVMTKAFEIELERREIIVLDQAQKNELAKLKLKLNKRVMKEAAKAEQYEKRRKAKMLRYGYLYEPYEVEIIDPETNELKKETRYKNFTTNSFINKYKEFANFYSNLADSTKKIITKTIKIILWLGIITGICFALYGLVKWLVNGSIKNFIEVGGQVVRSINKI